jgi:UTP--glucose-1-phosphate uridylyltransferase
MVRPDPNQPARVLSAGPHKAVIPAAGLGTRMLPLTKSIAKGMLPVGDKPMIRHVVEEAITAGITQVCIVIRKDETDIHEYFSRPPAYAADQGKSSAELDELLARCEFSFVYQQEPLGIGDAVLRAREFVGNDSFLLMMPDQLMLSKIPAALQLIKSWRRGLDILSGLVRIAKADLSFFAGARGVEFAEQEGEFVIHRLQTESETHAIYRDCAYEVRGFGRTIYSTEIFNYLGKEFVNPQTGEIDLWQTFQACAEKLQHRGIFLEGEPSDLGTLAGYYHYLPRFQQTQN